MRIWTKLLIVSLLFALTFGCASTVVFKPDSTDAKASTVLVKERESYYVQNEQVDFSAGLAYYNNDSLGLYLYFKNNSQAPIRVDPATIGCKGLTKEGLEDSVAIKDPGKYIQGQRNANAVLVALGGLKNDRSAQIDNLDKSLLRKQDVLPGQQLEGLVLISRVFVEKGVGNSKQQIETVFQKYLVSFDFGGQAYGVSFHREELKE